MPKSTGTKLFSIDARLANLRDRHRQAKSKIAEELKRPAPCSFTLQKLKRKRLKIKDEVARYDGLLRTLENLQSGRRQSI
jgi:hypothetical protein